MNDVLQVEDYLKQLPEIDHSVLANEWQKVRPTFDHKIVVLDDDPTGVQTVHGVSVYTDWEQKTIEQGFYEDDQMFFILTNSRSFSEKKSEEAHRLIAKRVEIASQKYNIPYLIISRGDSTLRGHYPLETEVLRQEMETHSGSPIDGEILIPFFKEGGRFTIDGTHYVKSNSDYIPAGETEFAKDRTFGFRSSHLGEWVEEMTKGRFENKDVTIIKLESLRNIDIETIKEQLNQVKDFHKVIVNGVTEEDIQVFTLALIKSIHNGKRFLFRTAASFTKVIGNISSKPLLTKEDLVANGSIYGGLVVIGSHVQKTTDQLNELKELRDLNFIEFDSHLVLNEDALQIEMDRVRREADSSIRAGVSSVIYTRRERLDLGEGREEEELKLSVQISQSVTNIVRDLSSTPKYIIAKGGITSSDIGTNGLGVQRAKVMGQVAPGIPAWQTDAKSKFPNLPYIIFPGNVGNTSALKKIVESIN